jgi:signal transduction histidine kinase
MTRAAGIDAGDATPVGAQAGSAELSPAAAPEMPPHAAAERRRKRPRLVSRAEAASAVPARSAPAESVVHLLAAELHDGLSQQLFAAELDIHELRCTPGLSPEVHRVLDRLASRLEIGSKELRGALFKMLEAEREQEDLLAVTDRIRDAIADFRARHAGTATLEVEGTGPEPGTAASRLLLRTVREGLANVAKHAEASAALVVLRRGRRWWTVEVHDDGTGDPALVRDSVAGATSFGLYSLVNEASRVGGRLWVERAPGLGGVQLNVSVPVGPALRP